MEWTGAENDESDRAHVAARKEAAYQEYLKAIMQLPQGVSPSQAARVAGTGPERKDFNQYASLDPEGASREMDAWERGMGVPQASDPNAQSNQFRKGTMAAPSDGEQIPYYTNQPVGQEDARAQNLVPFNAGIGATSGISGPDPAQATDPRMREVAMRARRAREMIALVPKSEDVVTREAARRLPGFVNDIKTLGLEGASAKNLGAIESGELSTDVMNKMLGLAKVEVQQQDESEYAKTREAWVRRAELSGTLNAQRALQEDLMRGVGDNPKHLQRIEAELKDRGKTTVEMTDSASDPTTGEYLPLTANDVAFFKGGTSAPLASGTIDRSAPPTVSNPHDGPTTLAQNAANADAAIQKLMGTVKLPELVGTAARAPSSYTTTDAGPASGSLGTAENPRSDIGKGMRNVLQAMRKRQHKSDVAPYDPYAQSDIAKLLGF